MTEIMPLFSRRTLQRLVHENCSFLTDRQSQTHIDRLDDIAQLSFAYEWEVVLLNVLNKVGRVAHEKELGTRKPDVLFTSRSSPDVTFIADIVTVSDEGLEKEQPVKAFERELHQHLLKFGLRLNSFSVFFNRLEATRHGERPKVKVPKRNRLRLDYFNNDFKQFLSRVMRNPRVPDRYIVKTRDVDVWLEYNPTQRFSSMTLPAHDITYDLVRNPVYYALHNKAKKLREAQFSGTRGIILCDGGSAMFHFRKTSSYQLFFATDKVIKEFFRQNNSIAFVLLIVIEIQKSDDGRERRNVVKTELYENDFHAALNEELRIKLTTLERLFPTPVTDARSAISSVKKFGRKKEGWSFYTQLPMNGMNEIKISGRTLLGLLAGTINQQEYLKDYGFMPNQENTLPFRNPFLFNMEKGKLIKEITVEQSQLEDDDFICFKFGDPDPAVSPFALHSQTELGTISSDSPLAGIWLLDGKFPDGRTITLKLEIHQEGRKFYGALETDEGIAHINTIDVQHSSFKIGLPSYTLNEQQFDAEIVGDVNATNLSAKLILSSDNGTTLSFPFTSVRKEVKH